MSRSVKKLTVAVAIAVSATVAGASALHWSGVLDGAAPGSLSVAGFGGGSVAAGNGGGATAESQGARPYIVVFNEAPLASYRGDIAGLAAAPRMKQGKNRARLDVKSREALGYVAFLDRAQRGHETDIGRKLGRSLRVSKRMHHALNAIITELTPEEVARIQGLAGVSLIEEYREYQLDTDLGPSLIGAPSVWQGSYPGATGSAQGEGIVVGIIDTGINFGSPSFAGVDPVDGYQHINPLGTGNYLGSCAPGGVDAGLCTDKLIGAWDFVCDTAPSAAFPNETSCNTPAKYRESPGGTDTNSHGSHTASTAAGNRRDVVYRGSPLRISGVAPRANIVAYDVCYTNVATGQGSCPNTSSVSAVNQAIADGVDVLNFSIGGGGSPWSDTVSLAFLNAADAGIYVAASAGNSGPGPNTMGHLEPWVANTAASNTGRSGFSFALNVTGPGQVPENLAPLLMNEGSGGVSLTASLAGTTPLVPSPGIDSTSDGCAAFPAGTFAGAIAVIRRGTCSFTIKANNAAAAGAVAVVIANNTAGAIAPSVPGTTIPAFGVLQAAGNAIRDFAVANAGATAGISFPPLTIPNMADALGSFSSRGPAAAYNLIKPNITAPGVAILAAVASTTGVDDDAMVDLMSGTSMASPHHAGAAALLRQAQPTWSVAEVRSALQMTAKPDVFKEDTVTLGTPFDRGSGRVQVAEAARAGLVLNETKANFLAADPAIGGDLTALNLPSMANGVCVDRCVFKRTFRNTLSFRQAWSVKVNGLSGSASPSLFTLNPGESKTVTITINAYSLVQDGAWNFGTVVLQPQSVGNPNQPWLRLPVGVAVPPAVMVATPDPVNVTVPAGSNGVAVVNVANAGGAKLGFTVDNSGVGKANVVNASSVGVSSGFRSTSYTDPATAGNPAQYASDDFTLAEATRITNLFAEGFVSSGSALASTAASLTWSIFPDDGTGQPAGNPQVSPQLAVWSYTSGTSGAGVSTANNNIRLNLDAAGQNNVMLQPGRYWLVVQARTSFANRWVWFASNQGDGSFMTITPGTAGTGAWTAGSGFPGLAWLLQGNVGCGAPWIGAATPTTGQITGGGSSNVQLQLNTAGLAAGSYSAYACFSSNDPVRPKAAVKVALTVTP